MTTFLHNNCPKMLTPRRWEISVTMVGQMYFGIGWHKVKILCCPFCGKKAKQILKYDYPEFFNRKNKK